MARQPLKNQVIIALNTGMRKGEILKLKWDSIKLNERIIETRSTTRRYAKAIIEGKRRLVNSFQIGEKDGEVMEMPSKQRKID
jgi:integrase